MRFLVFLLSLALSIPLLASPPSDSLESEFGFRLTSPGAAWQLLDSDAVRAIQPRAVAGLVLGNELHNVVVIEDLPSTSLTELARGWADNSGLEEVQLDLFEEFRFQGRPAVRWMVTGRSDGAAWSQHFVIFSHDQSLFRLVSWGNAENVSRDGSSFRPFLDAFHLLDFKPAGTAEDPSSPEVRGVGWILSGGSWKSPAYGMEIRPEAAWRVLCGSELRGFSMTAGVGMFDEDSKTRLTLEFPKLDKSSREQWSQQILASATVDAIESKEGILVEMSGVELELRMYESRSGGDGQSVGMRMLRGSVMRENRCVEIRVDYPVARENAALINLRQAFGAMRFLMPQEASAIDATIAASRRDLGQVGDGYSLRSGVYRDFRFGLTWSRPSGKWEVEIGEQAFERMTNAVLTFYNPYSEIRGAVIPVPVSSLPPEEWHARVLDEMYGQSHFQQLDETRSIELGGLVAHYSATKPSAGFAPIQYRLLTTANDSWAFQIHFWGSPDVLELKQQDLDAAIASFEIAATPTAPVFVSGGALYDDRLGFQLLSPGAEWSLGDDGKQFFWPAGSLAEWVRGDDECIGVIAVCGLTANEEIDFLASLVRHGFPESFAEWLHQDPQVSEIYFCGKSVRELTWEQSGRRATCWIVPQEEILYLVYATDAENKYNRTRVCNLFSLLP